MNEELVLAARVVSVTVGFPLLTWAFGAAVLGRCTRLDGEERFAASFGVGFAVQALAAFLAFVLHAPQPYFNLGVAVLMLGLALLCRFTADKQPVENPVSWPLAVVFALGVLHLVCLSALLPAYHGSSWYFDWWMHYDEALVFLGDRPLDTTWANGYTLASRTPLFNLTTAFVMGIAGHGYDTYQLASALPSFCFPLALYLLLRDLFNLRAAWLVLLLAPLNVWMLHNAWFTWPKMLAAYYLVLALHFYMQSLRHRRADPARAAAYFVAFWTSSVFGYMTHQVALVYTLPLLLHASVMAVRERTCRPRPRELLACLLLTAAVIGSWYAWLDAALGKDKITGSTPITLGDENVRFNPLAIMTWMGNNLRFSVVPNGLGEAFVEDVPPNTEPAADCLVVYSYDGRLWCVHAWADMASLYGCVTQLYFSQLPGAVTLSVSAFVLVIGTRRLWWKIARLRKKVVASPSKKEEANKPPVWSAVWFFLVVGTLSAAFLHPGRIPWGIAHSAAFPTTIVLAALGWGLLSRAGLTALRLVGCGMVVEFLLMFWSYWWLAFHNTQVLEPGPGVVGPRENAVRLLNESLGRGDVVFLVGAIVVQVALIGLLFAHSRRDNGSTS